jgi:hypothetical protein
MMCEQLCQLINLVFGKFFLYGSLFFIPQEAFLNLLSIISSFEFKMLLFMFMAIKTLV